MATHRWTTDDEIHFLEELSKNNRPAFLNYVAEIGGRGRWGEMDDKRIKAFVGVLRSSRPQGQEMMSS